MTSLASHDEVTLALAKKESAEHLHGMKEVYDDMRQRSLLVRAYAIDDPNSPSLGDDSGDRFVKIGVYRHLLYFAWFLFLAKV